MATPQDGLAEVARQREQVAMRVRLPCWYLVLYGFGAAMLLAGPVLATQYRLGIVGFAVQALGASILCSPAFLLQRVTGIRLHVRTAATYPSVRRTIPLLVASPMAGIALNIPLTLAEQPVPALVVAALVGVGMALALRYVYLRIGRDIAEGTARK